MEGLKEKAVRGGFIKIWTQAAVFFLRMGSLMVLARLLEPKDFGLVAMVTAVTGIFDLFKTAGLSVVTIQREKITDEQVSTLFWINIAIGGILAILTLALAPVLVAFYHEPRLLWITMALASGFLFNAAGVQHGALLQRQMRFVTLGIIDVVCLVLYAAVGIGMALLGLGYWSLIGMALVSPLVSSISVWVLAGWIPGPPRRGVGVRSMLKFGGTVTLDSIVTYIGYNAEKVLLGRFWGTDALGIYGRAYQLVNLPTRNLNSAIGGVAYSALSRLQGDPHRFRSYFLKGYSLVLALTLPITIACALLANDLILVILGPKWKDAIVLLRLLAPTILAFALIDPFSWLLVSIGKVMRSLKIGLVIAPLVIAAYFIGLPHGPKGVAIGYSAMMMLLIIPVIAWCKHGTVITSRDVWRAVRPPVLSGLVAAAFTLGVSLFLIQGLSPVPRLIMGAAAMIGSYLGMLLFAMRQKAFYLGLVREIIKPRRTC
jgi:O-antigen/teichoic acid export membrane protein